MKTSIYSLFSEFNQIIYTNQCEILANYDIVSGMLDEQYKRTGEGDHNYCKVVVAAEPEEESIYRTNGGTDHTYCKVAAKAPYKSRLKPQEIGDIVDLTCKRRSHRKKSSIDYLHFHNEGNKRYIKKKVEDKAIFNYQKEIARRVEFERRQEFNRIVERARRVEYEQREMVRIKQLEQEAEQDMLNNLDEMLEKSDQYVTNWFVDYLTKK